MPPVRRRGGEYDTTYARGYRRYHPVFRVSGLRQHVNPYYWVRRSDDEEDHIVEPLGGLRRRLSSDLSLYDSFERGAKRVAQEAKLVTRNMVGRAGRGRYGRRRMVRRRRNGFIRNKSFRWAVKKIISEKFGKFEQVINQTGNVEATTGRQGVSTNTGTGMVAINDRVDITKVLTGNPYDVALTSAKNYKMQAMKTTVDIQFVNPGNVVVDVWWFHCVPRVDSIVHSPVTAWVDGLGEEGVTTGSGSAATVNDIGVWPFMSRTFSKWWHVLKVLRYRMLPGDVKHIKYTWKGMKMYTYGDWEDANDNSKLVRPGWTHVWFPVIRGQTAHVEDTPTSVSTTAGTLIWTATKVYTQQMYEGEEEANQVAASSNFSTAFTLGVRNEEEPEVLEVVDPA